MALPQIIPQLSSNAVASYPYEDFASGLGYQDFYLIIDQDSGGFENFLTNDSSSYSADIEVSFGNGTNEKNFDSSVFNQSRTIKGVASFSFGVGSASGAGTATLSLRLLKVGTNGTTETEIMGTITSDNFSNEADQRMYMQGECTETVISPGEKLRVEVIATGTSMNDTSAYGTDPGDRNGSIITPTTQDTTTIFKVGIPFRIYE